VGQQNCREPGKDLGGLGGKGAIGCGQTSEVFLGRIENCREPGKDLGGLGVKGAIACGQTSEVLWGAAKIVESRGKTSEVWG
jgi:hypothetical protein